MVNEQWYIELNSSGNSRGGIKGKFEWIRYAQAQMEEAEAYFDVKDLEIYSNPI